MTETKDIFEKEIIENNINEFYKLKSKYETEINKNKKKIINNTTLSKKEKQQEFKKLKPKCINCKRPGGTLFSIKNNEKENFRELKAICGILTDPCNLNITIQVSKYELLQNLLKEIEIEIKDNKNKIINDKNQLLFGFITSETALEKFDELKDNISTYSSLLEHYLDLYLQITDNKEFKIETDDSIERSYEMIKQIKESIHQFNLTNNTQFVRDAVILYTSNLKPLLNDGIFYSG
jgi:hypothetical protein